jgi:hypothetical protein
MRARGKLAIGVALIFVFGAVQGCTRGPEPRADFAMADTRDFYLWIEPKAWARITEHKGRGWIDELLDAKVHAQINWLIEEGLRMNHVECKRHWLLSAIRPLDDGSVLFAGYCASEAELRAGRQTAVPWDGAT